MAHGTKTPLRHKTINPPPSPYPHTPYPHTPYPQHPSVPPPISPQPMPIYYQNAPPQYLHTSYPVYIMFNHHTSKLNHPLKYQITETDLPMKEDLQKPIPLWLNP